MENTHGENNSVTNPDASLAKQNQVAAEPQEYATESSATHVPKMESKLTTLESPIAAGSIDPENMNLHWEQWTVTML